MQFKGSMTYAHIFGCTENLILARSGPIPSHVSFVKLGDLLWIIWFGLIPNKKFYETKSQFKGYSRIVLRSIGNTRECKVQMQFFPNTSIIIWSSTWFSTKCSSIVYWTPAKLRWRELKHSWYVGYLCWHSILCYHSQPADQPPTVVV